MNRSGMWRGNGVTLRFEEKGEGEPVFFQHGLGAAAAQPAEVFPDEPPVRRITLECRGHGGSDLGPPDKLSLAIFSEDVAGLAEHLGIKCAIVGGISMGAAVGLRIAVRRRELVKALILARPAWLFDRAPETLQPYALVAKLLLEMDRDAARHVFLASAIAKRLADAAPDNLASLLGFLDRPAVEPTAALLSAIAGDGPGISEQEARSITVPTLIIGTAQDLVHALAFAEKLTAIIPNAEMVEITSKSVSRERYVAEFRVAVAAFLRRVLD